MKGICDKSNCWASGGMEDMGGGILVNSNEGRGRYISVNQIISFGLNGKVPCLCALIARPPQDASSTNVSTNNSLLVVYSH